MPPSPALAPALGHLRAEPSRTWSVIVTLYGDAIVPRGGGLWLGTVLEVFAAMGIGGNVVRTAMSRLAADGWLARSRIGRNAYYRLSDEGGATFADAAHRIYDARPPAWDGAFHLAVLAPDAREALRPELDRFGFGALAPGVLIAPALPAGADQLLAGQVVLRATTDAPHARRLADQVWPGARLAASYRRFLAAFLPLRDALARETALSDLDALIARLLLVHEYRRLVLRDPLLPAALLPADWPGLAARVLCGELYPILLPGSERWLDQHALCEAGPLPPPDQRLDGRFGI